MFKILNVPVFLWRVCSCDHKIKQVLYLFYCLWCVYVVCIILDFILCITLLILYFPVLLVFNFVMYMQGTIVNYSVALNWFSFIK